MRISTPRAPNLLASAALDCGGNVGFVFEITRFTWNAGLLLADGLFEFCTESALVFVWAMIGLNDCDDRDDTNTFGDTLGLLPAGRVFDCAGTFGVFGIAVDTLRVLELGFVFVFREPNPFVFNAGAGVFVIVV